MGTKKNVYFCNYISSFSFICLLQFSLEKDNKKGRSKWSMYIYHVFFYSIDFLIVLKFIENEINAISKKKGCCHINFLEHSRNIQIFYFFLYFFFYFKL
jgi:hypothetical protein